MWKVVIFLLSTVLGVFLFALFVWRVNNPNAALSVVPDEITLSFSFVGSFLVSFGWLWRGIKCPECRKSIAGHILKTAPAGAWFTTLIGLRKCPLCGYAAIDQK
jgi:hypothetical protein